MLDGQPFTDPALVARRPDADDPALFAAARRVEQAHRAAVERGLALAPHVRRVKTDLYHVPSQSGGEGYLVMRTEGGLVCSCQAGRRRPEAPCAHRAAVVLVRERERAETRQRQRHDRAAWDALAHGLCAGLSPPAERQGDADVAVDERAGPPRRKRWAGVAEDEPRPDGRTRMKDTTVVDLTPAPQRPAASVPSRRQRLAERRAQFRALTESHLHVDALGRLVADDPDERLFHLAIQVVAQRERELHDAAHPFLRPQRGWPVGIDPRRLRYVLAARARGLFGEAA